MNIHIFRRMMAARVCTVIVIAAAGLLFSSPVSGQRVLGDGSVYMSVGTGISHYSGDLSTVNAEKGSVGMLGAAAELGYQFTSRFGAAFLFTAGSYPRAGDPGFRYNKNPWEDGFLESRSPVHGSTWRYSAQLMLEYAMALQSPFSPYVRLGAHTTQGGTLTGAEGIYQTSIGPAFEAGGILDVSDRIGLFLAGNLVVSTPDKAVDGFTDRTISDDRSFDLLSSVRVGTRIRLNSPATSLGGIFVHGPSELGVDEVGYFAVGGQRTSSDGVSYEWEMGDGTTVTGPVLRHAYARADTFVVTLRVSNARHTRSVSKAVTVVSEVPVAGRGAPPDTTAADTAAVTVVDTTDAARAAAEPPPEAAGTDSAAAGSGDAATACQSAVEKARSTYHQQAYARVRDQLGPCMSAQTTDTARIEMYRLIGLSYLKEGSYEQAKEAVLKLLGIEPTYTSDPVRDPPDYAALVNVVRHQLGLE